MALSALTPTACAAEVALLVEDGLGGPPAVSSEAAVRVYRFGPGVAGDPIAIGRLLSRLEAADGVVVVGPDAAEWAARELEDARVHFAGGLARVPGSGLLAHAWSGTLSGAGTPLLDYARRAGWRRIGVAYTPGFESALAPLRSAAARRGLRLDERAIAGRAQIGGAVASLMGSCDAFWIVGDPLLTMGGGFEAIVESSLANRVPVLAPEPELVGEGAFLAEEPNWRAILRRAVSLAEGVGSGQREWPDARAAPAQDPGSLLMNEVLRRRWGTVRGGGP